MAKDLFGERLEEATKGLVARVIEEHATIGLGILDRLKDQIEAGKTEALSSENSEKYWRDQVAPTIDQLIMDLSIIIKCKDNRNIDIKEERKKS